MTEVFRSYPTRDDVYDEMFAAPTDVRANYALFESAVADFSPDEFSARSEYLRSTYVDQGVTFDFGGEEHPFPLDIIPRLINAQEWADIEAGVKQRIRTLEMFLTDIYSTGHVFNDGVIPRKVVVTSPHFHRAAAGFQPDNAVRIHVSGIDLIRDGQGTFRVLEDNVRIPSGVSYVMTNRRALSAALPEAFQHHLVRPVRVYPERLLAALRAAAPSGIRDPTVVVMTPGVYNSAYFEHALLARMMGVELVEGRDLVCQNGRIMMRTTRGLQRVHVIYRRVDDDFLDPQHFRKDSLLGVAGLVNAARAGNVTICNAIGNGVADDKLVYTYVPDLVRYYLGEEPLLKSVDTWRLEDPEHRAEVLDRLDELVLKPVDGSGGKGIVIGPAASQEEIDEVRKKVVADPRGWIAQPVVQLSTVPTLIDGAMRPRHVDLRPFAINSGTDVYVLPGGLTRVALPEGKLIVNSSQGGGSKDTWVLGSPEDAVAPVPEPAVAPTRWRRHVDDASPAPRTRGISMMPTAGDRPGSGAMAQQMSATGMSQVLGDMRQSFGDMAQAIGGPIPAPEPSDGHAVEAAEHDHPNVSAVEDDQADHDDVDHGDYESGEGDH